MKKMYAKDYKCCKCKTKQAVAFFPACDPDIQAFPFCRKCLVEEKMNIMKAIFIKKKRKVMNDEQEK